MKNQKMKKVFSMLLTAILAASTLAACGRGNQSEKQEGSIATATKSEEEKSSIVESTVEEAEGITYPLTEDVTLTLAMVEETQVTSTGVKNLFETPFGKALQEQTGVKIEVIQLADQDAMNLMFAGGELPDLVWFNYSSLYAGGAPKAIKDKVIEPLNDYIEYLPDMMAALESNPDYIKAATTDDGDIIGGPFVRDDEMLKTSAGMMVRQDWLDELGMEIPQTPDEVYDMLKAFKEKKGAEVPWSTQLWWIRDIALPHGLITSPFGLPKCGFYQENGTVQYGYYKKEYKDVLSWMNKLYSEGLLDPNFQTLDGATANSNIMNGISGMTIGSTGGGMGNYLSTMADIDPNYNLSGVAPLVAKRGDIAMSTYYDNAVTGWFLTMSPTCKNKEAAAKFINYGYTEAGKMLFNFGIEGESYNMVDGYPTYTDLIMSNPDGLTIQQAMTLYQRAWHAGPFLQQKEYIEQYYVLDQQKKALAAWSTSKAADYQLPAVVIAPESASKFSKLTADINIYIEEMMIKYITGQKSLDTFETEYLATLQKMGVEEVIEMYQTALDNYNAR